MNDFRADLHCHSTCSDGTLTPIEIIKLAKKIGLKGLSITDHDIIEAYKTTLPIAQEAGITLISGVELSAYHNRTSVHILGYSFSTESPIIEEFCLRHTRRRLDRNRQILTLLSKHGVHITEEDIQCEQGSKHTIGRPHIALAMLKKRYVNSIQEAFHKYIGEGRSCFSSGGYFSVEETIDVIHKAGGLAIIAHPHLIENQQTLNDLLSMNFDGIETFYARFPLPQNEKWNKIAEKKNWLITGGSDFHGEIKPTINLGCSWINEEKFKPLLDHFIKAQERPLEM